MKVLMAVRSRFFDAAHRRHERRIRRCGLRTLGQALETFGQLLRPHTAISAWLFSAQKQLIFSVRPGTS
jgi:hypothetical protein